MSDGNGPSLVEVVSAATLVLGLIAGCLYVTGWTYAYHYFDKFHIPMLLVELPREHLFVYGGLVAWKNPVIVALAMLSVFVAACTSVRYRARLRRFGLVTVFIAMVLLLFVGGFLKAIASAQADFEFQRTADYPAFPRVRFSLNVLEARSTDLLADLLTTDCGRLILSTSNHLLLIRPIAGAAQAELSTFAVPWDNVQFLRIVNHYTSCP